MELLRASTTLATVGNMQASESSEALTAIMNGFKLETEDAMEVVDKLSHLDLIAATSSEELAVALQRVSAYADSAGVSIDKMLAYITTVSSVTRLSAETIGTGWKSIFSRMQNVKASKQFDDYGESIEIHNYIWYWCSIIHNLHKNELSLIDSKLLQRGQRGRR